MKAMIMAAGLGKRMLPLTLYTPKGLLTVDGIPLIVWKIKKLAEIGITDIIINVSYLAEQIQAHLKNGEEFGVNITYSLETQPLEVGGGIIKALPLLGDEAFIIINCDIWTDYPLQNLMTHPVTLGHLVLVQNPDHNRKGDFNIDAENKVRIAEAGIQASYTYPGIALFHPKLFFNYPKNCVQALKPILEKAIAEEQLTGEVYNGTWIDIGTPERLESIQHMKKV